MLLFTILFSFIADANAQKSFRVLVWILIIHHSCEWKIDILRKSRLCFFQ